MASLNRRYSDDRLGWAHTDIFKANLDPFTFTVYMNLAARADTSGKAWPKQTTIAADCGISERQVRNCLERLVSSKLIVVLEQSGTMGGRRSVYYLATRNEWISKQLFPDEQPASAAGSESSNRQMLPVQPASAAGSLYQGIDPKELIQNEVPEPSKKGSKGKKNRIDPKPFLHDFPVEFKHDDSFVEAWTNWGEMRNEMKKPLTPQAAKLAMNRLTAYPVPVAVKALDRSTLSGWTGVFPESIGKGPNGGKFEAASAKQPEQDFGF